MLRKEYLTAMLNKLGLNVHYTERKLSYSMEEIANRLGMTMPLLQKSQTMTVKQLIKIIHANPKFQRRIEMNQSIDEKF